MSSLSPQLNQKSLKAGQVYLELELEGVALQGFSKAAVQSYWRFPKWKFIVEAGGCPWEFARSNKLFVTHGHADHLQGIFSYISTRNLLNMQPGEIFVPEHCYDSVLKVLKSWQELSDDNFDYILKPLNQLDKVSCTPQVYVQSFDTDHRLKSFGYRVFETKKKLKAEFSDFSSEQIAELRRKDVSVSSLYQKQKFAFTSDTSIKVFDKEPSLYDAESLIVECTFLDETTKKTASETGHIHIDELAERAQLFKNKNLVLCHFSQRYSDEHIVEVCNSKLGGKLAGVNLVLWI